MRRAWKMYDWYNYDKIWKYLTCLALSLLHDILKYNLKRKTKITSINELTQEMLSVIAIFYIYPHFILDCSFLYEFAEPLLQILVFYKYVIIKMFHINNSDSGSRFV